MNDGTAGPQIRLNALSPADAEAELFRCCGSTRWVEAMLALRPFASLSELFLSAERVWATLERSDYLEAFSHHPQIGADLANLRANFASTADWSENEQSELRDADQRTLQALRAANVAYENRFGFIFIVCASGKSAKQMLESVEARLQNVVETELSVAAREQSRITQIRLERLLT